jgi:hypothetical protein
MCRASHQKEMSGPQKRQATKNRECPLRFCSLDLPSGGSRVPPVLRHPRSTRSQQFRCAAKVRRWIFVLRARLAFQALAAHGTQKWARRLVDTCRSATERERIPRLWPGVVIEAPTLRSNRPLRDTDLRCAAIVTTDARSRQPKQFRGNKIRCAESRLKRLTNGISCRQFDSLRYP